MAKVTNRTTNIVSLHFQQERGDPDYGSCLWAVFNFDLDHYELSIMSDCGSYAYGWVPTPNSESFMHLMARVDGGYLIDKLSKRNFINKADTFKEVKLLIDDYGIKPSEPNEYGDPTIDLDEVRECCEETTDQGIILALQDLFRDTPMADCDESDLWGCICMDFSANAKKITQVFIDYIKPICKEISDKEEK